MARGLAAITIQLIVWRAFMKAIRHATSTYFMALNFKRGVAAMQALLAVCVACSGKPGAAERKEAGRRKKVSRQEQG